MRKAITLLCLLTVALCAVAAEPMKVVDQGQFAVQFAASTGEVFLSPGNGKIVNEDFRLVNQTNETTFVYAPSLEATIASRANTTTMALYTKASNVVDGVSLAVGDVIIFDDPAITAKRTSISGIGAFASGITTYTISATATDLAAGEKVWIADATGNDILRIAQKFGEDQAELKNMFVGKKDKPVDIVAQGNAGRTTILSGTYTIQK